jgi:hypothetical protein
MPNQYTKNNTKNYHTISNIFQTIETIIHLNIKLFKLLKYILILSI